MDRFPTGARSPARSAPEAPTGTLQDPPGSEIGRVRHLEGLAAFTRRRPFAIREFLWQICGGFTSDPRTFFTYNLDRDLTRIDRPDGSAVVIGYDGAGRVSSVLTSRGTTQPTYSTATGHITSLAAPAGEGLAYTYDGSLPKRITWSGTVAGYVEHGFDSDFRVSSQNVNGAQSVSFGYDNDSLLTSAGSETLTRHVQTGLLTNTSLGVVGTTLGYNPFGEQTSETATISGSSVYATTFTRDDLGRITQKVETIQGTTTTYDYRYDTAARLDQVKHDGAVVRSYGYDANGNRLSALQAATTTRIGSSPTAARPTPTTWRGISRARRTRVERPGTSTTSSAISRRSPFRAARRSPTRSTGRIGGSASA